MGNIVGNNDKNTQLRNYCNNQRKMWSWLGEGSWKCWELARIWMYFENETDLLKAYARRQKAWGWPDCFAVGSDPRSWRGRGEYSGDREVAWELSSLVLDVPLTGHIMLGKSLRSQFSFCKARANPSGVLGWQTLGIHMASCDQRT